ncbi:MAG: hypothetical protein CM15mP40_13980 [Alphaproteobacteria bacterium]|nr:MAG: hypothetical protein CM15mP40_13980 [Alphaproteobacteria bacterium]
MEFLKSALNDLKGALEDFSRIINIDKTFKDTEQKFNTLNKKLNKQEPIEDPWGNDSNLKKNPFPKT